MSQEQTWPRLRNGKNELCGSESPLRRQETQKFCEVGAAVAEGKTGSLNVSRVLGYCETHALRGHKLRLHPGLRGKLLRMRIRLLI